MINEKYEHIAPQLDYLQDEVILTQAWKKSHNYIRQHNWYSDILELDISTINLTSKIKKWRESLSLEAKYETDPLRVVLAPKNQQWIFPEESEDLWSPKESEEEGNFQELRSLAHLSIKDQTTATAIMLCLADAIETTQGPSEEENFIKAHKKQIFSYGNRLHCEWENQLNKNAKANYSWGSSKCYRQYYEDYKLFLKRPLNVCEYYSPNLYLDKELYVISLDLQKFYDRVDISFLINQLEKIYKEYYENYNLPPEFEDNPSFWEKAKEVLNWDWLEADKNLKGGDFAPLLLGLPQGLVASGFFANAYLINFDKLVGNNINKIIDDTDMKILDYCRYVDDIRLVVEAPNNISTEEVREKVEELIEKNMKTHLKESKEIKLNRGKTKVVPYRQISSESNVATKMNSIQGRLSGVPDADTLKQLVGELTGLLKISETLEEKEEEQGNKLKLSKIAMPYREIRDDTLKRFSATRLVKALRLKRSMTTYRDKAENTNFYTNDFPTEESLNHEYETVARQLIFSWAKNPSLSLLLKYALDLYPSEKLLYPVLEAFESKLFNDNVSIDQRKTIEYIASDLLRAASLTIGNKNEKEYPKDINIKNFKEELAIFAKKLLEEKYQFPWYVQQQATLYLLTTGNVGFENHSLDTELNQYKRLQSSLLYNYKDNTNPVDTIVLALIAQQLDPNPHKFAKWFISWLPTLDNENKKQIIKLILLEHPALIGEVFKSERTNELNLLDEIPDNLKTLFLISESVDFNKSNGRPIPLLKIIKSDNNPFTQENALLALASAILVDENSLKNLNNGLGIEHILIEPGSWNNIQNPYKNKLKISWLKQGVNSDFKLFETPSWIEPKNQWTYVLGTVLRSCITGEFDFTTNSFLTTKDIGRYKGVKSTSYTRAFSLINRGKGLNDEFSPITPWVNELLYKLLQWPGVKQWDEEIKGWSHFSDVPSLSSIIDKRILHQKKIYGRLSNTPTYSIPIKRRVKKESSILKFAIVQPLLPQSNDFDVKNPLHWNTLYRKKHRNHLASICELVIKQIEATVTAQGDKNSADFSEGVDVIVFPELSIHPDDIDILKGLSDKTKAHIFAGLTFIEYEQTSEVVNQALWLLRSERKTGREFIEIYQGKNYMTTNEKKMNIKPHRPFQIIVELEGYGEKTIKLTGAICYDATDLAIAADLRDVSDVFLVSALNKDIQTFDNMIAYLHYHMYQPVILANTGEFGGSSVQAPFTKHNRTIAHIHGNQQIGISIFDIDPTVFKKISKSKMQLDLKTPPAGYEGR